MTKVKLVLNSRHSVQVTIELATGHKFKLYFYGLMPLKVILNFK